MLIIAWASQLPVDGINASGLMLHVLPLPTHTLFRKQIYSFASDNKPAFRVKQLFIPVRIKLLLFGEIYEQLLQRRKVTERNSSEAAMKQPTKQLFTVQCRTNALVVTIGEGTYGLETPKIYFYLKFIFSCINIYALATYIFTLHSGTFNKLYK